jgi:hypothetical protein
MLQRNATLTMLWLDYNPLTNSGVRIIFDALCYNYGLQRLNIRCSEMTGKCMKDIQRMFQQNKTLTELNVYRKSFTNEEQDQLLAMAATKQNRQIKFDES